MKKCGMKDGGKVQEDMVKMGRNLAKVANQGGQIKGMAKGGRVGTGKMRGGGAATRGVDTYGDQD